MTDELNPLPVALGRRHFFRIGGMSVAAAAVIAACGQSEAGQLGRVGLAPTTTKAPEATVSDAVLLRTATSLQFSLLKVLNQIVGDDELLDPKYATIAARFIADHEADAELLQGLTTRAGGEPWTCPNPKFDSVLIDPSFARITEGAPAAADAPAVPPSDDKRRDVLNLLHGMESITAASYQQMVTLLTDPALRVEVLRAGVRQARHAALLALNINPDRPGGYVVQNAADSGESTPPATTLPGFPATSIQNNSGETTTTAADGPVTDANGNTLTEIPSVTAIPGQFGATATLGIVVGAGDQNGTRLKVNLETPSLNSYIYDYLEPACPAT